MELFPLHGNSRLIGQFADKTSPVLLYSWTIVNSAKCLRKIGIM